MKILHISDTHGIHELVNIPEVDVLIHSGDCSNSSNSGINANEVLKFFDWFDSIKVKNKIYVAGNHDVSIARGLVTAKYRNFHYLENQPLEIDGVKFWGSPYTPTFYDWAFMMDRHKLERVWSMMPDDTDVVITHGPPKGILDLAIDYMNNKAVFQCGCSALLNRVLNVRPKLHLFGHIHNEGQIINTGIRQYNNITFSNAAVSSHRFEMVYGGTLLEI